MTGVFAFARPDGVAHAALAGVEAERLWQLCTGALLNATDDCPVEEDGGTTVRLAQSLVDQILATERLTKVRRTR